MITYENLSKVMANLQRGDIKAKEAVKHMRKHVRNAKWPSSLSKEAFIDGCTNLLNGKVKTDDHTSLVNALFMCTTVVKSLSKVQKESLKKIITMCKEMEDTVCGHKNVGLYPFLHGGGFCEVIAAPELICSDCGLNVTIHSHKDRLGNPGMKIKKEFLIKLCAWCCKQLNEEKRRIWSSSMIMSDPIGMAAKSIKWPGKVEIKIVNKKKVEARSGQ